jgi:hypothetical protein
VAVVSMSKREFSRLDVWIVPLGGRSQTGAAM